MVRNYRSLVLWAAMRNIPPDFRKLLIEMSLWDDIKQELRMLAFVAQRDRLDTNQTVRLVNHAIYRAIKSLGFRKPKGSGRWIKMEQPLGSLRQFVR